MKSRLNSMEARDVAHYLHPFTNLSLHEQQGPHIIDHGEGIYVFDDAGTRYIEALSGSSSAALGFSEERLIEAAMEQMRKLPFYHVFAHKSHKPGIELAERLINIAPVPMSKVLFANSGSEANDIALKLVWYYNNAIGRPRKKKAISRHLAYHGATIAAASLTGQIELHQDFDLPVAGVLHTCCPNYYRYGRSGESEEEFATRCAESLEELILSEGPETIAVFFAEPVMASGGCILPPRTYFAKIQAVLKRYDVLFVADEVICGFGRTGNMFATETYALEPDMISIAKPLSASYLPISALMINDKIYRAIVSQSERLGTFGHGLTFGGHPVPAAVALEVLKIYDERKIVQHVQDVSPRFQDRLQRLSTHPLVGDSRGVGLLGGLELVKDKTSRELFPRSDGVTTLVGKRLQANGVITRWSTHTVNLCPPLIITLDQIDDMFERITKALNEAYAETAEQRRGNDQQRAGNRH
jgi:4-aminobutyrate---pyruvate transaminase